MTDQVTGVAVPRVIQIQVGSLAFIDRKGLLESVVPVLGIPEVKTQASAMPITPADRFVMAVGQDCGVFVRNLNPVHDVAYALALLPSFAPLLAFKPKGTTYLDLITELETMDARRLIQSTLTAQSAKSQTALFALANYERAINSPIWAPDLLAEYIVENMGTQIEVRIFGGTSTSSGAPEIVSVLNQVLLSLDVSPVLEESIRDFDSPQLQLIASINPHATRGSDHIRGQRPVDKVDEVITYMEQVGK